MSVVQHTLVERRLVHKTFEKNVLVANLRRELPKVISGQTLAKLSASSSQLCNQIQRLYVPWTSEPLPEWFSDDNRAVVAKCLHGLIVHSNDNYEKHLKQIRSHDRPFFDRCYAKSDDGRRYILRKNLNEIALERLVRIVSPAGSLGTQNDTYEFATQLDRVGGLQSRDERVFYALLHVDTTHEFFFEHSIEHVPANMLVEAVRQFVVAGCHIYVDIPLQGVQFILSKLEGTFSNYLDLWYPIVMCARVVSGGKTAEMRWDVCLEVEVAQRGCIGATFTLVGEAIRTELFERLRHHALAQLRGHWFALAPHLSQSFSWCQKDHPVLRAAHVVALAHDRLRIKLDASSLAEPCGDCTIALSVGGMGTISGQTTVVRVWSTPDGHYAELQLAGTNSPEIAALTRLIMQHGMLIEDVNETSETRPFFGLNHELCHA